MKDYDREALEMICGLCKRLNPQHTGDPDTCDCLDVAFLRKTATKTPSIEANDPAALRVRYAAWESACAWLDTLELSDNSDVWKTLRLQQKENLYAAIFGAKKSEAVFSDGSTDWHNWMRDVAKISPSDSSSIALVWATVVHCKIDSAGRAKTFADKALVEHRIEANVAGQDFSDELYAAVMGEQE
jgi:hypothetical protein